MYFCPEDCPYLDPNEEEQEEMSGGDNRKKIPHMCLKYRKRVYHGGFHSSLMVLNECIKNQPRNILEYAVAFREEL